MKTYWANIWIVTAGRTQAGIEYETREEAVASSFGWDGRQDKALNSRVKVTLKTCS